MKIKSGSDWEERYQRGDIGWDMGRVSPPLKAYFDQLSDKTLEILIPGAGNAYEAEYLYNLGFENVYIADIAKMPLQNFAQRTPHFPKEKILHINFFDISQQFDFIVEQTFFCALDPSQRMAYAKQIQNVLKPNAKLVGVLFDFPLTDAGPPFGGNQLEYLKYFKERFKIHKLERCYNSHPKRSGKELFINFENNA